MDELEISGKRYISTRRAGKEHKYHSDYIGQLIRANKVAGQKVGRAWYVDAESLTAYLNSEPAEKEMPAREEAVPPAKVAVAEKIIEKKKEEPAPVVVEEKKIAEVKEIVEEKAEPVLQELDTYRIPIAKIKEEARKPVGLRYIQDDAPLLPVLEKNSSFISVMPRMKEEVPVPPAQRRQTKKISRARVAGVFLALGGITFAIILTLSGLVVSTSTVGQNQTASTHYAIIESWKSF